MKQLTRWTATLAIVAMASAAQADLNRVGPPALPSPPGNGFPAWYQDLNGLTLDICLPNASGDTGQAQQAACLLTGVGIEPPYVFPTNYPDEIFFFRAVSDVLDTSANGAAGTNKAILVLALEAAFASGGAQAGQQIVFTRIRVTAGVPHAGTYTVTHPYGIETFVVDVATGKRDIFFSEDIGINPGAFTDALASRVGPFLQASAVEGGAPKAPITINGASFLSDGVGLELLTGSPFGTNYFEMCGPFDGAANPDTCRKTPLFSLTGRLHSGLIGSPLRVDRASYSRSGSVAQVDVSANAKAGIGQPAPKLTTASSSVSPVLLNGPTALGEWYAQGIPVPASAIPSQLTVTNSADSPPTSVVARVTDLVTVTSANYAGGTLTVVATTTDKGDFSNSSDPLLPPSLRLDGFPQASVSRASSSDPAQTTFTVSSLTVPPPSVRVSSAAGGQGQMEVVMGPTAAFAGGVPLAVDDNAVATAGGGEIPVFVMDNDVLGSVLLNAAPLAIIGVPTAGTATVRTDAGTGAFYVGYLPSNLAGTETFQYTVRNAEGQSNVATVTVEVGPNPNPTPVAVNDPTVGALALTTGATITVNVLGNDSGNGGTLDPASVLVSSVTGGTAVVNPATGTINYTAGAATGNFGITYTVANTNGLRSNPATVALTVTAPETITLKGAQCQRQGTQWVVQGSSTVQTGTMTIFNVGLVPAAPTVSQVIANVPISAGKWQYNVKGGPACVSPISLQSTGGGKLQNVNVAIK
jgi:hypothetical protein